MSNCICYNCGDEFDEKDLEMIPFLKHGQFNTYTGSPCCAAGYGYLEDEVVS